MRRLCFLLTAVLLLPMSISPANAESLASTSNGVNVPSSEKSAKIEYSLPATVVLGANDSIKWAVTEISSADTFGNRSIDLLKGEITDYSDSSPLTYVLSPFGRKASLDFSSTFAGVYVVTVTARVGTNTYSNTQRITLSVSPMRNIMNYSDGQAPSLVFESPDVGKDLQTVIRFKINWKRPTQTNVPDGPYWVNMWAVDSAGKLVRQPWQDANPNSKIFHSDPLLNQTLSTGTDWINLPVKYKDWVASGGVHIRVWWSLSDSQRNHYIWFEKIFDIPVNFPRPTPLLSTTCSDVFEEEESSCSVALMYVNALGESVPGSPQNISWQLFEGTKQVEAKSGIAIQSGTDLFVPIPKGKTELTLKVNIDNTQVFSSGIAKRHDYTSDVLDSIRLLKSCPSNYKGTQFTCKLTLSAVTKKDFLVLVNLQEQIDGAAWKTVKKINLTTNSSTSVSLPSNEKKSLAFRAQIIYMGRTYYSATQSWEVTESNSGSNSGSDPQIAAIRSGLKEGCSRIPKTLNIKYVGPGPSSGGNSSRTYKINSVFTVVIYDLGDSWNFGAYPLLGQNQNTAALWNCGVGGKGAVLRTYFVDK